MIHALLALAPIVLLLALLARGHYPGEAAIAAARDRRARPVASRRRPAEVVVVLPLRILLPRGGALLARRLAGRAPPPSWSAPT